jgi:chemotaxis protein CheZ
MSGKPFTAELQRQGLPLRRAAVVPTPVLPVEVAKVLTEPAGSSADMIAALDRIERRLEDLAALQPAPGAAPEAGPGPDLEDLQQRILLTHIEIAALRHPLAKQDRLVVAGEELAAIIRATEHATNDVLCAAEQIEKVAILLRGHVTDPELGPQIDTILDAVVRIFEACNFQDITGQRINKVVRTLDFIEERVANMIQTWGSEAFINLPPPVEVAENAEKQLLNGPQLEGKAISQADIDALFA